MSDEVLKYFISFVSEEHGFSNTEIYRNNFIESIEEIKEIEEELNNKFPHLKTIKIINYRLF